MSSDEPLFHTIAIAGLGLIGGSIALAVREHWPSIRIVGVDEPSVLAHAMGSGAIERAAASIDEIGSPDLIVLAAPVRQNVELLRHLASLAGGREGPSPRGEGFQGGAGGPSFPAESALRRSPRGTVVVTDVGGTKRDIVDAAAALTAPFAFVGGHPIGGAERGGFGFARPDLFAGRPWILTPAAQTPPDVLARLQRFVVGLGARPAILEAADHDRLMAYVSHLPQLTASALMAVVGGGAAPGLKLAGRGLVDTTRLASSPASVWRDIAASNADFVGEALDELIRSLTELRSDLDRGESLERIFSAAGRCRADLMQGRD
jgi:prephenate dehydrogenase